MFPRFLQFWKVVKIIYKPNGILGAFSQNMVKREKCENHTPSLNFDFSGNIDFPLKVTFSRKC